MTEGKPECGNCKYYGWDIGWCKKKSPVLTTEGTRWPMVPRDEYCGEHEFNGPIEKVKAIDKNLNKD